MNDDASLENQVCHKCSQSKPMTEFWKNKGEKLGKCKSCKACMSVYHKEKRAAIKLGDGYTHKEKAGIVYFLFCEGRTKIGITTRTVALRLQSMSLPFPAKLVGRLMVKNLHHAEGVLHIHFNEYRVHGEWFDLPKSIVNAVYYCKTVEDVIAIRKPKSPTPY